MAFLAQQGALIDELIEAVAGIPKTRRQQRAALRDFVARSLQGHTFTRTNQFEVQDRLRGLEERFAVCGREALAEALDQRLGSLQQHQTPTTPEVLHLLLELADRPAQHAKLSDLDALVAPQEHAPPPLTWREIAREDGWKNERDIWRFIDYAPGSSDEDGVDVESHASLESRPSASSSSSAPEIPPRTAQDAAVRPQGDALLQKVRGSQSWRHAAAADSEGRPRKIPITTTQLLREALFMLAGLPTSLFDSACDPIAKYQLRGVSWEVHRALVTSFAECGLKLAPLRVVADAAEQSPLLQVFQDCVQRALRSFDLELSRIQARLVHARQDNAVVVTPISVLEELGPRLAPLEALADIVRHVRLERNSHHTLRYLELLYRAVGLAQLQGNRETYRLLGTIFFDCFQVYLKPIRLWMEQGELVPGDRSFFIAASPTKLPLPQVWKGQFALLRNPQGALYAPRFLDPAIHRIFTAGKSIVVLKLMGRHEAVRKHKATAEPAMDFATVCPDELEYAPFSELFDGAFRAWIQSKHHTAAATLRELLFRSYGLSQNLDALHRLYLMSDGARSDAFASAIFGHLDARSPGWRDPFTLTETAQEAFSACLDAGRLSAAVDPRALADAGSPPDARSSVRRALPAIRLHYRLPWPVHIVVTDDALRGYQALFTFQLQVRRALGVLRAPILPLLRRGSPRASPDLALYCLVRTKLLWFCNTLLTYLTTLVLAPAAARLHEDLGSAPAAAAADDDDDDADVDDMVAAHAAFVARATAEACLGARLQPVREAMLDVLDLAIRLEDAQRDELERGGGGKGTERRTMTDEEGYEEKGTAGEKMEGGERGRSDKSPTAVLREVHAEFERLLKVVAAGLRGVARASKEEAAAKWDLLAEMLEAGIKM
ncbi:hypothetical protein VTJ83DRAFT_5777 [Remersonia thermophila]|uniref:Spindle pole body component n=1 Tax=Remersonia thermophila TaxID=72144 RepID=A0ABR4D7T9_9PEZI